jgi:PEP-CTERM motif
MRHSLKLLTTALLGFAAVSSSAKAAVIIDIFQQGSDVVTTGSGTIDLTDLSVGVSGVSVGSLLRPLSGQVYLGPTSAAPINLWAGISGPTSFGSLSNNTPSSGSGDFFGVEGASGGLIALATTYVSGGQLSATDTYSSETLSSLGLTPGSYVYTWGTDGHADSLTVNIAAVPEPSTWAMMILGFAGVGFMAYRRKANQNRTAINAA